MGIGAIQATLIKELRQTGNWKGIKTICELGSQIPLRRELLDLVSPDYDGSLTARDFYAGLGIADYVAIDFNGAQGALSFDLNNDLGQTYGYGETFDLVTNFGTSEHCFNQFAIFKNIHNLCGKGGYIAHTLPSQGWGRHCLFRYDVNFFADLAKANDYDLLVLKPFLRIGNYVKRDRSTTIDPILTLCNSILRQMDQPASREPPARGPAARAAEKALRRKELLALRAVGKSNALFSITLGCLLRKKNDAPFVTPIQGMYANSAAPASLSAETS